MNELNGYVSAVSQSIRSKQKDDFASAVSLSKTSYLPPTSVTDRSIDSVCQSMIPDPKYCDMIAALIKSRKYIGCNDFVKANEFQQAGVIKFQELFRGESNWIVPVLHHITYDTRILAMKADAQLSQQKGGSVHDCLRNAEQNLKKGFALVVNDRAPPDQSKKWGSLYIVNQLFKIYFKLNTIRLCRNLIRAVEGPAFPEFEKFNLRDKVTYKFYVGRISMFEDQYEKAEKCLWYAWNHCHRGYEKNKRMILRYLIPVRLLLGILPSEELVQKYGLENFSHIVKAVRTGNLKLYNEVLRHSQEQFIQQGIYLILEKLRMVVIRNLFKKIYIIRARHQLRFEDFAVALEIADGQKVEMDEVECILANLIFKGYMKGYLSHAKKVLVLSKKMPFPTIASVQS